MIQKPPEYNAAGIYELRLEKAEALLRTIVEVESIDAGVVLLSQDSPADWSEADQCFVYQHVHFSPLGDALVRLHNILIGRED